MADSKESSEKNQTGFFQAAGKAFDFLTAIRLFFAEIKESFARHWDWFLRRVEYLFVVYLWISVGILLMILGIFDLLIDFYRIPRGVVFSFGGLLILLVAVIFLQAAKMKKRGK